MKNVADCENMTDIRFAIDKFDQQIVELIAKRSGYVKKAAEFKSNPKEVKDSDRVAQVIESKKELAEEYGISPELIGIIYKHMIDFFINQEMQEWQTK